MNDWIKEEMQALRDYMGKPNFGKEQEGGVFVYEDKDEGLLIMVKPTGDHNFELTINDGETTENALEVVGDLIINTFSFCYHNTDPNWNDIWDEIFAKKKKQDD